MRTVTRPTQAPLAVVLRSLHQLTLYSWSDLAAGYKSPTAETALVIGELAMNRQRHRQRYRVTRSLDCPLVVALDSASSGDRRPGELL